jgi:hypothetical protein
MKIKSNKVKMIITDNEGTILDEFNTEDDFDLFFDLIYGKSNPYMTPRVIDALEVAIDDAENKMKEEDERKWNIRS